MKTITIDNPNDDSYPFSKDWYGDHCIVYHGTSSVYSESIEKKGWQINGQTYDKEDFQKICKFFEDISWDGETGGKSTLKAYALEGEDEHIFAKPVSFSQEYRTARRYSENAGGESINGLFLGIKDIFNFVKDERLQDEHKKYLESELNELLNMQQKSKNPEELNFSINYWQKCLDNFSIDYLQNGKNISKDIFKKYEYIQKKHFPVIYVVKVEPKWFKDEYSYCFEEDFNDKELEIITKTNIPHTSIIARVNFPNGVKMMKVCKDSWF